jgi:hypothetical protein
MEEARLALMYDAGDPRRQLPGIMRRARKTAKKKWYRQRRKRRWTSADGVHSDRPACSAMGPSANRPEWFGPQLAMHLDHEANGGEGQNPPILDIRHQVEPFGTTDLDIWKVIFNMTGLHYTNQPPAILDVARGNCPQKWFDFGLSTDGVSGRWLMKKKVGGGDLAGANDDGGGEEEEGDQAGGFEHLPQNRSGVPFDPKAQYTFIDPGKTLQLLLLF